MKTFVRGELPAKLLVRAAWGVALLTGAVALALIVSGCGSQDTGGSVASSSTTEPLVVPASVEAASPPATIATTTPKSSEEIPSSSYGDQLPPELSVSGPDSLVVPGSVIEIQAEASPDVESLVLRDDLGHAQAFAESEGGVWLATYRVPMKPGSRLGLSVTATNASKRWSRSWVFVNVQGRETP